MDRYDEKAKKIMSAIYNGFAFGKNGLVDAEAIATFGRECAAETLTQMALSLQQFGEAGLDGTSEMRNKRNAMRFAASLLCTEAAALRSAQEKPFSHREDECVIRDCDEHEPEKKP